MSLTLLKGSSSGPDNMIKSFFAIPLLFASLSGWIGRDHAAIQFRAAGGSSRLEEVVSLRPGV